MVIDYFVTAMNRLIPQYEVVLIQLLLIVIQKLLWVVVGVLHSCISGFCFILMATHNY